jgi:hypothetical protein
MTDPDDPPILPRTTVRVLVSAVVLIVLAALCVFGWGLYRQLMSDRDRGAFAELNRKAASGLTDAEFDTVLSLSRSRDPGIRAAALGLAATGTDPTDWKRRTLVVTAALLRLDDPNPDVRRTAIDAIGAVGSPVHLSSIQPFQASADPAEREAANRAAKKLRPTAVGGR